MASRVLFRWSNDETEAIRSRRSFRGSCIWRYFGVSDLRYRTSEGVSGKMSFFADCRHMYRIADPICDTEMQDVYAVEGYTQIDPSRTWTRPEEVVTLSV